MKNNVLTIEEHSRQTIDGFQYVYPVVSRRSKGISIGINLNPDKICNFSCIYCQVDRSFNFSKEVDAELIKKELSYILDLIKNKTIFSFEPFSSVAEKFKRVNDICFAGDGEPTSCKEFEKIVQSVIDLKNEFCLNDIKIILITNATLLNRDNVKKAIDNMMKNNGEIWAKLDAGTEIFYNKIANSSISFSRILDNLKLTAKNHQITIQSLFLELDGKIPEKEELIAYCNCINDIIISGGNINLIQIYTIARKTPSNNIYSLTNNELDDIASFIRNNIKDVKIETYYGSKLYMNPTNV